MTDAANRLSYRNGWADGRKIGRAEMRRLIRRRLRRMANGGGHEIAVNALLDAADIVCGPSREER